MNMHTKASAVASTVATAIATVMTAAMLAGCSKSPDVTVTSAAASAAVVNVSDIDVTEHVKTTCSRTNRSRPLTSRS